MAAELAFDLVIEELKKGAEPLTRTTVRQKIDEVASFFHRSYRGENIGTTYHETLNPLKI